MRRAPDQARLTAMNTATPKQRVILDAAIDRSVIRGVLTAPTGGQREFHGWLELNTALETILGAAAGHAPNDSRAARAALPPAGSGSRSSHPDV
jgi:hypothetical protein